MKMLSINGAGSKRQVRSRVPDNAASSELNFVVSMVLYMSVN